MEFLGWRKPDQRNSRKASLRRPSSHFEKPTSHELATSRSTVSTSPARQRSDGCQVLRNGLHKLPVAVLAAVRIVAGDVRVAVAAVAIGPVELLVAGLLRGPVIGVVKSFDAADVIVELLRRGARLPRSAAAGAARGGL